MEKGQITSEQTPLTLKAFALDFLMFVLRLVWGIIKWIFLIGIFTVFVIPIVLMFSTVWDALRPKRSRRF